MDIRFRRIQFDSNYCCKSIVELEEYFVPIDAWIKIYSFQL